MNFKKDLVTILIISKQFKKYNIRMRERKHNLTFQIIRILHNNLKNLIIKEIGRTLKCQQQEISTHIVQLLLIKLVNIKNWLL